MFCWRYFLVQVVWKDVGCYVSSSGLTSFLLCADSISGKFPVSSVCFAGDLLLCYCLAAVFITRYLPRWSLHYKISSAAIFIARIFTLMESLLCDIRMRPGKETRDIFQDCPAAIKAVCSPLAVLTLFDQTLRALRRARSADWEAVCFGFKWCIFLKHYSTD